MRPLGHRRAWAVLRAALALLALCPGAGGAQGTAAPAAAPTPASFLQDDSPVLVPRSAFLRSLVVPGWGHLLSRSYTRAGVYFTIQSASAWMLWKSRVRRTEADRLGGAERTAARDRLIADGIIDPFELAAEIEEDPKVLEWEGLSRVRDAQVEDWAAFSIFMVLLGATDAYVSAHLVDYPEPLRFDVLPSRTGEGVDLRWSLPLGRPAAR